LLQKNPVIFYQLPPLESLYKFQDAHIIWIPMWDEARGYDQKWWDHLPKAWRVVSFSNEISQRSRAVGLKTFDVRYFMSPGECGQADWSKSRTLFYWNRTGIIGESFLRKLCKALDVELLLFRRRIDPGQPSRCDYELPQRLGKTFVKELTFDGIDAHRQYLEQLNHANIFIAPRLFEGVGLSFIEAAARGCAIFAYDAPTMNEYISHKTNGYLLQQHSRSVFNMVQWQMSKQLRRIEKQFGYKRPSYPITNLQNWSEIHELDLQTLGNNAKQVQFSGFKAWENIIPQYASFILDW
jgi:hypothetical protein